MCCLVWPFSIANLAIATDASWLAMKVNAFSDESYGMPGQFVYLHGTHAHTEDVHTSTHVPVWAGLLDVFMTRACSLRNCSISDLRSRREKTKI